MGGDTRMFVVLVFVLWFFALMLGFPEGKPATPLWNALEEWACVRDSEEEGTRIY
jgi:hypothetical protein